MKKVTYTAFVAFWTSVATILALTALAPDTVADEEDLPVYTLSDLEEHDDESSCWMAIEGRVYDLTEYIPLHPTPPSVMLPWCGGEATEGMRTKGYGRDHSPAGWAMLDEYLIGVLEED